VLAGLQDLFADLAMEAVGREADDDLDLRIGEELFGSEHALDAILLGAEVRGFRVDIGDGADLDGVDLLSGLDIDPADDAATQDANLGRCSGHVPTSLTQE